MIWIYIEKKNRNKTRIAQRVPLSSATCSHILRRKKAGNKLRNALHPTRYILWLRCDINSSLKQLYYLYLQRIPYSHNINHTIRLLLLQYSNVWSVNDARQYWGVGTGPDCSHWGVGASSSARAQAAHTGVQYSNVWSVNDARQYWGVGAGSSARAQAARTGVLWVWRQ